MISKLQKQKVAQYKTKSMDKKIGMNQMIEAAGNQCILQLYDLKKPNIIQKCGSEEEWGGIGDLFAQENDWGAYDSPEKKIEVPEMTKEEMEKKKKEINEFITKIDEFWESEVTTTGSDVLYRGDSFIPTEGFKPKGKAEENKIGDYIMHSKSNTTPGYFISTSSNIDICKDFSGVKYITKLQNVIIVAVEEIKSKMEKFILESVNVSRNCDDLYDIISKNSINMKITQMNVAITYSNAQEEVLAVGDIVQASVIEVVSRESDWGKV